MCPWSKFNTLSFIESHSLMVKSAEPSLHNYLLPEAKIPPFGEKSAELTLWPRFKSHILKVLSADPNIIKLSNTRG